jgi:putative PIN family toxin of toxin-antitoxin system
MRKMTAHIVVDTNVYISAIRYGGPSRQVLDRVLNGKARLLISFHLKEELMRVLREGFRFTPQELSVIAALFWKRAHWIAPLRRVNIFPCEPDNRLLECALEGRADCIVTGDRHLLDLPPIKSPAILTPEAFLSRFA